MKDISPVNIAMREAANAEALAFGMYSIFASKLRDQGYVEAAMKMETLAQNEKEHMERWLEILGMIPAPEFILNKVAEMEDHDASSMYTKLYDLLHSANSEHAEMAKRLIQIEARHREVVKALAMFYNDGITVPHTGIWVCPHCGNYYTNKEEIPVDCPVCEHRGDEYIYIDSVLKADVRTGEG